MPEWVSGERMRRPRSHRQAAGLSNIGAQRGIGADALLLALLNTKRPGALEALNA